MPAIPTAAHNEVRRNSFYGRSRASSSGSSSSSSYSHGHNGGLSSAASSSSASTAKTASSVQRSSSPFSKKQAAVAAAASAASKRMQANAVAAAAAATTTATMSNGKAANSKAASSKTALMDSLRQDDPQSRCFLDEQEYQADVVKHMHQMEEETIACVDLMDAQPELRWYMRPYLVDFIVEIHQTFRLRPETLFLTMNIVDRYVSKRIVYKRHYQLVGCAALLIASKFEDAKDKVPLVSELAQMCCSAYDESAFVQMEGHVLSTIGWTLGFPTPEAWLRLACATGQEQGSAVEAAEADVLSTVSAIGLDAKTMNMTRFLLEVTLFTRDFIGLSSSHLTAGCLLLSRIIAGNGQDKLCLTETAAPKAIQVAQLIDGYLTEHAHELSEILVKKYSFSHFSCASTAIVQWYIAFVAQREAQESVLGQAITPSLLPAVSFSAASATVANAGSAAMTKSGSASSFSTPRRSAEDVQDDDEEDDLSMRSRSTTPSSMVSTPSQMSTDGEDDEDGEDDDHVHEDEDDEESDMPVTPLSLNSLHDPLAAAESKENGGKTSEGAVVKAAEQHLQPRDERRALALSQQDNRLVM